MAFYDTTWYCNFGNGSSTGYYAVALRPNNGAVAAGVLRRQFTAPAVGLERVFVCIIAGTTAAATDATWVLTRGARTTDGTATWQECTGASAVNGDLTNTVNWTAAKVAGVPTLGAIIQRNNGASYWICSVAGTMGASEPAWPNNTAGTTQADGTTTWTCLGVVGNFTGGGAPHARLANACASTWFAVGNTVYVGDNHAETQATAITITPAGSGVISTLGKILCHNHSGSYPPASSDLTTGATISTTAAVSITFNPSGASYYVYGIAFLAGVGGAFNAFIILAPNSAFYYFDNCLFKLAGTSATPQITLNAAFAGTVLWNNCTVYFGNVLQYIDIGSTNFTWQNTGSVLASGSLVPTGFMGQVTGARLSNVVLEALDLSQLTGGLDKQAANFETGNWLIKDCKLNASMTIPTPLAFGQTIQIVRSDSAATAYKSTRIVYEGTETTETSITRVGGSVDPTGQAQSRKIVTSVNAQWLRPFKAEPYAIWNAQTAVNVVVTVYGTINAGALPNNDDIWLEVEYLRSSATPLGTIVTTTKANLLSASAAVASDGSSWNVSATTLDGVPTNVTMSNGNLTATHGNTSLAGVSSTSFLLAGKYYFEVTVQVSTSNLDGMGFLLSTGNASDGNVTASTVMVVYGPGSSIIYANTVNSGKNLGATAVGDVVAAAIDLTARLVWFRRNNGNWNGDAAANPVTGVGGVSFTAGSYAPLVHFVNLSGATNAMTANFGASSYSGTPPSGFLSWDTGWTSFKLTTTLSSPQPGLAGYIHARVRAAKPTTTYYIDPVVTLS